MVSPIGCIRNLGSHQDSIPVNFSSITLKISIKGSLVKTEMAIYLLNNINILLNITILTSTNVSLKIDKLTKTHCNIACYITEDINFVSRPTIWNSSQIGVERSCRIFETPILDEASKGVSKYMKYDCYEGNRR
jgi:hypothetical protein